LRKRSKKTQEDVNPFEGRGRGKSQPSPEERDGFGQARGKQNRSPNLLQGLTHLKKGSAKPSGQKKKKRNGRKRRRGTAKIEPKNEILLRKTERGQDRGGGK